MENKTSRAEILKSVSNDNIVQISERAFMSAYLDVLQSPIVLLLAASLMRVHGVSTDEVSALMASIGATLSGKFFENGNEEEDPING